VDETITQGTYKRRDVVIGREFVKRLRWSHGRIETVTTRFELDEQGQLIEHVTLEVQERPAVTAPPAAPPLKNAAPALQGRPPNAGAERWL
jgi:hypothetical protein